MIPMIQHRGRHARRAGPILCLLVLLPVAGGLAGCHGTCGCGFGAGTGGGGGAMLDGGSGPEERTGIGTHYNARSRDVTGPATMRAPR